MISCSRASRGPLLLGLAVGLGLAGCAGTPEPSAGPPATPSAARPAKAPAGATGLLALPTANQVGQAVRFGRSDPFAALPQPHPPPPSAGRSSAPPSTPVPAGAPLAHRSAAPLAHRSGASLPPRSPGLADLRLTGLIRGGGAAYAVVETKGVSGSLRPGDLGGRTTDLLPPGWRVVAVDVARGRLVLQQGRRLLRLDL